MLGRLAVNFSEDPKKLFLIDGIGAILSAFLLGIVLVELNSVFGIPSSTLYLLASLPIFFALYDFYSYRKEDNKTSIRLKGIAITNWLYCFLSLGLAFFHRQTITIWGWTYIISEIVIVIALSYLELKVAGKVTKR